MSKRKIVSVELGTESFYDILDQKTPEEVIQRMQELRAEYPDRNVSFNVAPYGYDGGLELELWENREETDKEYSARLAKEKIERDRKKAATRAKKDKEYAEYERLRKKFENV